MQLPTLCCGASLLLLVLPWAGAQSAGGEHGAELRSLQVSGQGRAGAPGAATRTRPVGAKRAGTGLPVPPPRPPFLPSPSLSRTSWRRWGSSRRRKGNRPWKTNRWPGLRTAAPSGTSRGRRAVRRVPRSRRPALSSRRRGRTSGGASCPPTDGGTSPAALGRGWRGSARRRGWDATSTKPVGAGLEPAAPRGSGKRGSPELAPAHRSGGGRGSRRERPLSSAESLGAAPPAALCPSLPGFWRRGRS